MRSLYSKLFKVLLALSIMVLTGQHLVSEKIKYPDTPKIKFKEKVHTHVIQDNYRWLEKTSTPRVQEWLKQQNLFTQSYLETLPGRSWLIQRNAYYLKYYEILMGEKYSINKKGLKFWQERLKDTSDHWVIMIREKDQESPRILVDLDRFGKGVEMCDIIPSPNGKHLIFTVEKKGREDTRVHITNIKTHKILPDTLHGWKHNNISWLPDNSGFYYSANPQKGEVPPGEEHFWSTCYFHQLGTKKDQDRKILFHPSIKEYTHKATLIMKGKYLLLNRSWYSEGKNEIFLAKIGDEQNMHPMATGFDAKYGVRTSGDALWIQTNWQAPMGRIMIASPQKPGRAHWRELIPETPDKLISIHGNNSKSNYLFGRYLKNASTRIKIFSKFGEFIEEIPFPQVGEGSASFRKDKSQLKIIFSSFAFPMSEFTYDLKTGQLHFEKQLYPLEVDTKNYMTRQVWYRSKDGTRVSMFLIHRKGVKQNASNPCLLHGYGGFNRSYSPRFNSNFVTWLDAGGMVAVPNLRGGGEYGKKWHEWGILQNKQNTFDDCIAAAQWLIKNKFTSPKKLAMWGRSNGGLLAAAMAVQRPDLFGAIWIQVPLTDMTRFHKLGMTGVWINEYGNPQKAKDFDYLLKYSPLHNVKNDIPYPAILITAGENDPRCHPAHAMKLAARLREANTSNNPILIRVYKGAGHHSGMLTTKGATRLGEGWAFIMHHLHVTTVPH